MKPDALSVAIVACSRCGHAPHRPGLCDFGIVDGECPCDGPLAELAASLRRGAPAEKPMDALSEQEEHTLTYWLADPPVTVPPTGHWWIDLRLIVRRKLALQASALAEAKAEIERLRERVPHIEGDEKGWSLTWYVKPALHEELMCAQRGGRCALTSPSEPAGGRKGE